MYMAKTLFIYFLLKGPISRTILCMSKKTKLSTDNYKGVRDFYPEDLREQKYIRSKMREVVEGFGYEEYNASPLEYTEIYAAKSGEEIVKEQTYTFEDKGGRTVSLRPEMTPTVARMIAKKTRELTFPVRWYSIANLFRYESPQKGRLREHYQLNADIFGGVTEDADMEMISLIHAIMKSFGAKTTDFTIYINDRRLLNSLYDIHEIDSDLRPEISKLLDKKDKMNSKEFIRAMSELIEKEKTESLLENISSPNKVLEVLGQEDPSITHIINIIERLNRNSVTNVFFNPTLVRGFDYYTGLVFEVFDTDSKNPRSIFGGGRYDSLVSLFSDRDIPAVGFGLGDVRLLEFLKNHSLLPDYDSEIKIMICHAGSHSYAKSSAIANFFREDKIPTEVDISGKKLKDQISRASKRGIPFVIISGDDQTSEQIKIKHLVSKKELELGIEEVRNWVKETLNKNDSW